MNQTSLSIAGQFMTAFPNSHLFPGYSFEDLRDFRDSFLSIGTEDVSFYLGAICYNFLCGNIDTDTVDEIDWMLNRLDVDITDDLGQLTGKQDEFKLEHFSRLSDSQRDAVARFVEWAVTDQTIRAFNPFIGEFHKGAMSYWLQSP